MTMSNPIRHCMYQYEHILRQNGQLIVQRFDRHVSHISTT